MLRGNSKSKRTPYVCNIGLMAVTRSDFLRAASGAGSWRLADGGRPVVKDYQLNIAPEIACQSPPPLQLQRQVMAGSLVNG